ncbi:clustered mitochondria protein, partial [Tanacetum coccineum]
MSDNIPFEIQMEIIKKVDDVKSLVLSYKIDNFLDDAKYICLVYDETFKVTINLYEDKQMKLDTLFDMYVHNNIFFSFAVDADLKQFSKKKTLEANLNPSEKALAKSSTKVAESEQTTYASSNNDLKGTTAYQEVDVPRLYNIAMDIVNYRGHKVVAH